MGNTRYVRHACALAAFVWVAPALAQDSTTRCTRYRDTVNCQTTTLDAPPASDGSFERGMADLGSALRARRERRAEEKRRRDAAQLTGAVSARLQAGDCAGAQQIALQAGNIELASQVRAYCTTPTR